MYNVYKFKSPKEYWNHLKIWKSLEGVDSKIRKRPWKMIEGLERKHNVQVWKNDRGFREKA